MGKVETTLTNEKRTAKDLEVSKQDKSKKEVEEHKCFAILAIILGILYFIIVPFGQGTDEYAHYVRVYEISQKYTSLNYEDTTEFVKEFKDFKLFKKDDNISYQMYLENYDSFEMTSDEKEDILEYYWNTRLYSPIQYLPQVIGVTIGRIVSDNLITIGYFGRIAGFVAWLVACTYAIKIIPNKKIFLMILCLLPITIATAAAISGDTMTNAACAVFFALLYRKFYLQEKVSKKDMAILLISAIMIALCKIVYLPLVFLILLLKPENFKSKKEFRIFAIVLIVVSCVIGMAWLAISSNNLNETNAKAGEQLTYILEHPLRYIQTILNSILEFGINYIYEFTTGGTLMCGGKTSVNAVLSWSFGIVVAFSLFINSDNKDTKMDLPRQIWAWLIFVGIFILIFTAIYVQWTSGLYQIGISLIYGVQGRYFMPLVMLLIFLLDKTKIKTNSQWMVGFVAVMNIFVLYQIIEIFI